MWAVRMRQYLSKNGDIYLFRRRVPDEIVHRIGKREIYRSLGTTSVRIARQRLLYLVSRYGEALRYGTLPGGFRRPACRRGEILS
jgi:hypothetical protein